MMGERKKPSSLRGRVDRVRKSHSKPTNPMPIIVGTVFVVAAGVGLWVMFQKPSTAAKQPAAKPEKPAEVQPAAAAPVTASKPIKPKTPRDTVFQLCYDAKELAKANPDAALKTLEPALGQYPQYKVDLYHTMAMVIDRKVRKAGANPPKSILREKLDYLLKAKEAVDAGGEWIYDPRGNRTANLDMSIEQAEKEAR